MTKLKISKIKRGEETVTVTTAWGETFEAPAKGPVLAKDYYPSDEQMDEILEANLFLVSDEAEVLIDGIPVEELPARTAETQRKYDEARKENARYYRTLPRYFDYDRRGKKIVQR